MSVAKQYEIAFKMAAKLDPSMQKAFANTAKNFKGFDKNMKNSGKQAGLLQKTFGSLTGAMKALGVAALSYVGFRTFKTAIDAAVGFQDQMANVATLLDGDVQASLKTMESGVKNLAKLTGNETEMLTDGLYQVVSAFGDTKDNMGILETAAKSAMAGNATVADSVNLLSAVTKGYGDTSTEAVKKVSDLAFQTVKLGQTTFPELAANMGKVIPFASTLRIEQEELFGAMATLTGVTGGTAEVTTQLRATMQSFLKPTKNMEAQLQKLGYANGMAALESEGLDGMLKRLKDSVNGDEVALSNLFGSAEATSAVLALTGAQAENFAEKTNAMKEALGATESAFETKQRTAKAAMGRIKQYVNVAAINIGNKALPLIVDGLSYAMEMFDKAGPVANRFKERLQVLSPIIDIIRNSAIWLKDTGVDSFNAIRDAISKNIPQVENLDEKIQIAASMLENGFEAAKPIIEWIGTEGIPKAIEIMVEMHEKAKDVYNFIKSNWNVIGPIVMGVVASMAVYKGAMLTATVVTKGIALAQLAAAGAAKAFGLAMAFVTSPIGIVVLAIGAAIAIGMLLYKNWDWIKSKAGPIWEGIKNGIKGPVNGIIGYANAVITAYEKMLNGVGKIIGKIPSISIPEWVPGLGGKTFSIPKIPEVTLPKIPMLEKGGITTGPTLSMIGEGKEQEAILPLSRLESLLGIPPRDGGDTIHYSPQFIIQGNADKKVIEEAEKESFKRFTSNYEKFKRKRRRVTFAQ